MFRVGILGTENSHAAQFTRIFNKTGAEKYPDIKVVAVGGNDYEASKKLYDEYGLEFIAEKPEDMLGKVDAVMVTARHGDWHPIFARPFIEAGIPCFIDKPFACKKEEAFELARYAKEHHVPLIGGSSCKYAYDVRLMKNAVERARENNEPISADVTAPVNMHNDYGDFYFYSSHLAEISMTVFGYDPISVTASRTGDFVTVITHYKDFDVCNRFLEGLYQYGILLNTKSRALFREVDISMIFQHECDNFANMLRTGEMDQSYEDLILPVYYLNAIEESYTTGKTVEIEKPVL